MFRPVEQNSKSPAILLNHFLMVDHPAPKDADCASFLMLHFSAGLNGSIRGGLLTGDLTGRCHSCKPALEKDEIATALSVCFVWLLQSLWLQALNITGFLFNL